MTSKQVKINNKKRMIILVGGLFVLFFFFVLVPFWFINYLSLSGVGHFFEENSIYSLLSLGVFIYFIIVGEYYYNIEIDSYVIKITSYRVVLDLFRTKDYIDIPHEMLIGFEFFDRPFSFNKTLMLKINTNTRNKVVKRFDLTLISKMEEQKVRSILNTIIAKKK
jgi:hypothetical protein